MKKRIDCTKCINFGRATKGWNINKLVCSVDKKAVKGIGEDRRQYYCSNFALNSNRTGEDKS